MDYIENYTYNQEGGGSGGIPLQIYGTEYLGGSKNPTAEIGSIYFPGGLFVNSFYHSREEKDLDHTTKNIYENYDVFLDLVSSSSSSSSSQKHRHSKKIVFKKPKTKYSRKNKNT
jgi:hypothetical protein